MSTHLDELKAVDIQELIDDGVQKFQLLRKVLRLLKCFHFIITFQVILDVLFQLLLDNLEQIRITHLIYYCCLESSVREHLRIIISLIIVLYRR